MSDYKMITSNRNNETVTIEMPLHTAKALFIEYSSSLASIASDLNKNRKDMTEYGVSLETLEEISVDALNFYNTL